MKRYLRCDSAHRMYDDRMNYLSKMDELGGAEIEDMLKAETNQYLADYPEAEDWYDSEKRCRIVPPRELQFRPSRELQELAKSRGLAIKRTPSKHVPHYQWYVTPIN